MLKLSSFFWLKVCLFQWVSPLLLINKKYTSHFSNENKQFQETKTLISIAYLIRQMFQGYRCNRALASLNGGSLEIMLPVPWGSNIFLANIASRYPTTAANYIPVLEWIYIHLGIRLQQLTIYQSLSGYIFI